MRTRVAKDKQEHLKRTYFTTYNVNEFGWPIWLPCCSNPDKTPADVELIITPWAVFRSDSTPHIISTHYIWLTETPSSTSGPHVVSRGLSIPPVP